MIFGLAPACHRTSPELPSGASWAPRIVQRGHLPRPEPPGPPVLSQLIAAFSRMALLARDLDGRNS
jgi:hypothetical protein